MTEMGTFVLSEKEKNAHIFVCIATLSVYGIWTTALLWQVIGFFLPGSFAAMHVADWQVASLVLATFGLLVSLMILREHADRQTATTTNDASSRDASDLFRWSLLRILSHPGRV